MAESAENNHKVAESTSRENEASRQNMRYGCLKGRSFAADSVLYRDKMALTATLWL
jgi:hypothetical protein